MIYAVVIGALLVVGFGIWMWRHRIADRRERVQAERRSERQKRRVAEWASIDRRFPRKDKTPAQPADDEAS